MLWKNCRGGTLCSRCWDW